MRQSHIAGPRSLRGSAGEWVQVRENAVSRITLALVVAVLLALTGILTGTTVKPVADAGDSGSAAAMANSVAWWIFAGANACVVLVLAWFWWRRRQRLPAADQACRTRRTPLQRFLIVAGSLLLVAYGGFVLLRRWNPDEVWAARVIGEAVEVQVLLARYHETNGEYPRSLEDLNGEYLKPTDFLSRQAVTPERGGWYYTRIGRQGYQLSATAYAWVSYHDSLVYRSTGDFSEAWFSRPNGAWRDYGKWRYVKGFSVYDRTYYFDADGNAVQ